MVFRLRIYMDGYPTCTSEEPGSVKTSLISFLPSNPLLLGTSPGAGLESAFDQADAAFAGDVIHGAIDMSRRSLLFFVDSFRNMTCLVFRVQSCKLLLSTPAADGVAAAFLLTCFGNNCEECPQEDHAHPRQASQMC